MPGNVGKLQVGRKNKMEKIQKNFPASAYHESPCKQCAEQDCDARPKSLRGRHTSALFIPIEETELPGKETENHACLLHLGTCRWARASSRGWCLATNRESPFFNFAFYPRRTKILAQFHRPKPTVEAGKRPENDGNGGSLRGKWKEASWPIERKTDETYRKGDHS